MQLPNELPFRESGPEEYPNVPNAPMMPFEPSMEELMSSDKDTLVLVIKECLSYMRQVNNYLTRITPFVGGFNRLDGLQNEVVTIKEVINGNTSLLQEMSEFIESIAKEEGKAQDAQMEEIDHIKTWMASTDSILSSIGEQLSEHSAHIQHVDEYNKLVDVHNKALGMKEDFPFETYNEIVPDELEEVE